MPVKGSGYATLSIDRLNYDWLMQLQKKHPYLTSVNAILTFVRVKCNEILDEKLSKELNHNEVKE
jgi:hypothetical protein